MRPPIGLPTNNLRGVFWMLGAILALTAMFGFMKLLIQEKLPLFVAADLRNVFALLTMIPFVLRIGGPRGLATRRPWDHLRRSVYGNLAFVLLVYALDHLILADAMTLSFTTPLWAILTGLLLLGERIRLRRAIVILIGFGGVLLIVKPQGGVEPAAILALLSALATNLAMIEVKKLSSSEPPTRIGFWFLLFGLVVLAPPAIYTWQTPTALQFVWLFAAGLLTTLGQECLARAYGYGEMTIIAPMDYLRLPVAAAIGYFGFGELPDALSALGALVIIGTSFYIARYEGRRPPGPRPSP